MHRIVQQISNDNTDMLQNTAFNTYVIGFLYDWDQADNQSKVVEHLSKQNSWKNSW